MKSLGLVLDSERSFIQPDEFYDVSRYKNNGTSTAVTWLQLPTGLWVMGFNGTSSVVDIGDIDLNVQAFVGWIYPDDNTSRSIMDLDGGTHSVELDGSGDLTATSWDTPTTYVNGVASAAVSQSVWSFVAVTTATMFKASDLDIGKEATWFDGYITLVRLYSYILTVGQLNDAYANERRLLGV